MPFPRIAATSLGHVQEDISLVSNANFGRLTYMVLRISALSHRRAGPILKVPEAELGKDLLKVEFKSLIFQLGYIK